MKIYTIYDKKTETYGRPFFERSDQAALRSVRTVVNTPEQHNQYYKYPGDFELVQIGQYNDESGMLEAMTPQKLTELKALQDNTEDPK